MRNGWLTPVDYHLVTMIADLEKMEEEIKRQEKIKGKRLTPQETRANNF
jgi:hypothetical protein